MDTNKVREVARNHKVLSERRATQVSGGDTTGVETRALAEVWERIQQECAQYCEAYNNAFGAERIRAEPHADSVVVRSQLDQQDTVVFHRVSPSGTHHAGLEVHRYHYGQPPISAPVDLRLVDGHMRLTYQERDVAPETLVFDTLNTFAEQLALAESEAASRAANP